MTFEFGKKEDIISFRFDILENNHLKISMNTDFIEADIYEKLINDIDNSNLPLEVKNVYKKELITSIPISNYFFESIYDSTKEELERIVEYYIDEVEDEITEDNKSLEELNFGDGVKNYIHDYANSEWCIVMSKLITYDYIKNGNQIKLYFNDELFKTVNKQVITTYQVS